MSARKQPQRQRPGASSPIGRLQSQPEPVRVGEQVRESTSELADSGSSEERYSGSSEVSSSEVSEYETSVVPKSGTAEVPKSSSSEVPKFRSLERKDVRFRADQLDALSQLTRQVSAARTDRGERITENTLVRVAVDLLMGHAEQLRGNTETELRESVSTEVRNFGTSEGRG